METALDLPRCDASAKPGCGCGCSGGEIATEVSSLPWWVWAVAVGLFLIVSGESKTAVRAFSGRTRRRGRR